MKFIYVFSDQDMNMLVDAGYQLLKTDLRNDIYVFERKENEDVPDGLGKYCISSVLTF